MCGRYANDKGVDDLIQAFVATGGNPGDWMPAYSVAPSTSAPIVRQWRSEDTLHRDVELAAWGFQPAWAKGGGPRPINARLESAATNGMFRSSFAAQRCLVPMIGYFEWEARPDGKQPHYIHADGLLAAAGLYSARKEGDEWKISYAVITREARDASGEVHDRMPVFVGEDLWSDWLAPEKIEDKDAMLAEIDASSTAIARTMETYTVSRAVNSTHKLDPADPGLIAPLPA